MQLLETLPHHLIDRLEKVDVRWIAMIRTGVGKTATVAQITTVPPEIDVAMTDLGAVAAAERTRSESKTNVERSQQMTIGKLVRRTAIIGNERKQTIMLPPVMRTKSQRKREVDLVEIIAVRVVEVQRVVAVERTKSAHTGRRLHDGVARGIQTSTIVPNAASGSAAMSCLQVPVETMVQITTMLRTVEAMRSAGREVVGVTLRGSVGAEVEGGAVEGVETVLRNKIRCNSKKKSGIPIIPR